MAMHNIPVTKLGFEKVKIHLFFNKTRDKLDVLCVWFLVRDMVGLVGIPASSNAG